MDYGPWYLLSESRLELAKRSSGSRFEHRNYARLVPACQLPSHCPQTIVHSPLFPFTIPLRKTARCWIYVAYNPDGITRPRAGRSWI